MKRTAVFLLILFFISLCLPSFANIRSLLEEIEEEETENTTKTTPEPQEKTPPKKPLPPPPAPTNPPKGKPYPPKSSPKPVHTPPEKHHHYNPNDTAVCLDACTGILLDETIDLFAELLADFIVGTWFKLNSIISFGSYPYCPEGYIRQDLSNGYNQTNSANIKLYRGYAELSAFGMSFTKKTPQNNASSNASAPGIIRFKNIFDELSYGMDAEIHTYLLKCIGLDGEFWTINDSSGTLTGARTGLRISTIQAEQFSSGFYCHGLMWYNAAFLFGCALGLDLELYPCDPVVIQARSGVQLFDDDLLFLEADASLGFIIDRFEIFVAYRMWMLLGADYYHPYHGGRVGLRTYF
jgi:hypothetical protein